jgi:Na+-driven multidrug efflux pump
MLLQVRWSTWRDHHAWVRPSTPHVITWRLIGMAYLPGWGFAVAANTLVGQELGRRDPQRAMHAGYEAFYQALVVMIAIGIPIFFFAAPLVAIMTSDPEVIRAGTVSVQLSALMLAPMAGSFVFSGSLRGAGDTRTTLAITVISTWGVRVVLAYFLGLVLGWGLAGVWWAIVFDFAVRALLFWARFRFGRWHLIRI